MARANTYAGFGSLVGYMAMFQLPNSPTFVGALLPLPQLAADINSGMASRK